MPAREKASFLRLAGRKYEAAHITIFNPVFLSPKKFISL